MRIGKLPPNLTAVLAHVDAARAVYEYLHGDGFKKDARRMQELVREEAQAKYRFLTGWKYEQVSDVDAHWHPESWNVRRGDCIAIGVSTPIPVDDSEPFVYLYVPEKWPKSKGLEDRLLARKKRPYEHFRDAKNRDQGYERSYPVWVYVPYKDFARRSGTYDWGRFVAALVKALGVVLELRHEVDAAVQERPTRLNVVAK